MHPSFAPDNRTNIEKGYSGLSFDFSVGKPLRAQFANLAHQVISQLGIPVGLANRTAALVHLVLVVVGSIAKPQMVRRNAARVVSAWAIVKYAKVSGNWAKVNLPGDAMDKGGFTEMPAHAQYPIPTVVDAASPKPALGKRARSDVGPETLLDSATIAIVPMNEAARLASDAPNTEIRAFGKWRGLPTAALAQFDFLIRHRKVSYRLTVGTLAEGELPANRRPKQTIRFGSYCQTVIHPQHLHFTTCGGHPQDTAAFVPCRSALLPVQYCRRVTAAKHRVANCFAAKQIGSI